MTTAFISHSLFEAHTVPDGHPERPERLAAIERQLTVLKKESRLERFDAMPASREQLERVHTRRMIDQLQRLVPAEGMSAVDPDTFMGPRSLDAAWYAAGAAVLATRLVSEGRVQNAFCAVRPPGHHACRDRAMGFCLFNNVAVAAAFALEELGFERAAILDFDVHHGNGTQDIFAGDERVLFCSSFQHPFYPFSHTDSSQPNIVHAPLPAGSGGESFRQAIVDTWVPAVERFAPQIIFVSAGFDGHAEDELAHFELTDSDFRWVTEQVLALADASAGGRVVSVLEGGYSLDALGRCVGQHVDALAAA